MIEMELVGVRVEVPGNAPVVLLRERLDGGRVLPIFIGSPEATAIALALEDVHPPRPMTHDLMVKLLETLQATVDRVVVTDLQDRTFYAEIILVAGEQTITVECRPSDGIALAARTGSPIFAADTVLAEAAYEAEADDGDEEPVDPEEAEEMVEEFREFIENIRPEDFEN
ncbi:MAG: bifunctional nuclease family protein [Acidimicrobiales bacterium]|nr:bifunctional nuclease family protein [Acidimicrobiales bacterium]